jgi:hypothetical protein
VIPFGDPTPKSSQIDFKSFVNRYVRQLPQSQYSQDLTSWFANDGWFEAKISTGAVKMQDSDEAPFGDEADPWLLTPEFRFTMDTMFPCSEITANQFDWLNDVNSDSRRGILPSRPEYGLKDIDGQKIELNSVSGSNIDSSVSITLDDITGGTAVPLGSNLEGTLNFIRTVKSFPTSLWSGEDPKNLPKAMHTYLSGVQIEAKAYSEDPGSPISFEDLVEECQHPYNLPFQLPVSLLGSSTKPPQQGDGHLERIIDIVTDDELEESRSRFRDEVETIGGPKGGESR